MPLGALRFSRLVCGVLEVAGHCTTMAPEDGAVVLARSSNLRLQDRRLEMKEVVVHRGL